RRNWTCETTRGRRGGQFAACAFRIRRLLAGTEFPGLRAIEPTRVVGIDAAGLFFFQHSAVKDFQVVVGPGFFTDEAVADQHVLSRAAVGDPAVEFRAEPDEFGSRLCRPRTRRANPDAGHLERCFGRSLWLEKLHSQPFEKVLK